MKQGDFQWVEAFISDRPATVSELAIHCARQSQVAISIRLPALYYPGNCLSDDWFDRPYRDMLPEDH